jgi:hypothetical protein
MRMRAVARQTGIEGKLALAEQRFRKQQLRAEIWKVRRSQGGAGPAVMPPDEPLHIAAQTTVQRLRLGLVDRKRPRCERKASRQIGRHLQHIASQFDPEATESSSCPSSEEDDCPHWDDNDDGETGHRPRKRLPSGGPGAHKLPKAAGGSAADPKGKGASSVGGVGKRKLEPDDPKEIYMRTLEGKLISLQIDASDTVESLKAQVERKEHVPAAVQMLMWRETELGAGEHGR